MCGTDRHDMTLAVKVTLNPNTTNQENIVEKDEIAQKEQMRIMLNLGLSAVM